MDVVEALPVRLDRSRGGLGQDGRSPGGLGSGGSFGGSVCPDAGDLRGSVRQQPAAQREAICHHFVAAQGHRAGACLFLLEMHF